MNILDSHEYNLSFRLDLDAPNKYIKKWNKIKFECENTDIKNNCKLVSNKKLPYLDRCEGGLGGDNINKQIRFRMNSSIKLDNNIILYVYNTDSEKWSYNELDDLIRSFNKVLNNKMNCECINACIEIRNKNTFDDDYFDSDND